MQGGIIIPARTRELEHRPGAIKAFFMEDNGAAPLQDSIGVPSTRRIIPILGPSSELHGFAGLRHIRCAACACDPIAYAWIFLTYPSTIVSVFRVSRLLESGAARPIPSFHHPIGMALVTQSLVLPLTLSKGSDFPVRLLLSDCRFCQCPGLAATRPEHCLLIPMSVPFVSRSRLSADKTCDQSRLNFLLGFPC